MSRVMVAGLVLSSLVALASVAQAATMFTSPLEAAAANDLDCWIVNVSGSAKTVRIRVLGFNGIVLVDSNPVNLNAGRVFRQTVGGNQSPRYCRFDVQGGKSSYRAGAAIYQDEVGNIVATPAQ